MTGEKAGTLVVPRASIVRDGDRRYVYLLEDGQARRREVQVGLTGLTEVEIVSGVKEKDRVILPGSTALSEGLRVRRRGASNGARAPDACSTAKSSAWRWSASASTPCRRP